jgi:hypothetical protein
VEFKVVEELLEFVTDLAEAPAEAQQDQLAEMALQVAWSS